MVRAPGSYVVVVYRRSTRTAIYRYKEFNRDLMRDVACVTVPVMECGTDGHQL